MRNLGTRLAKLESLRSKAWERVRLIVLREGEPTPTAEPDELLIVRRIIKPKEAA